jgi:predicted outer membrane repeat protein
MALPLPLVCPDLTDDGTLNCAEDCQYCSFAQALIDVPADGALHQFEVAPGNYVEPQTLRVQLFRRAEFLADGGTVTLTNTGVGEVFAASDASELRLSGPFSLSAINDRAIRADSGALVHLNGAVLFTIGIQSEGGAVRVANATFEAFDTLFIDNVATGEGGQLLAIDSDVTLSGSRFSGGFGGLGGAVAFVQQNGDANLLVTNCTFQDNLAADSGGALYVEGHALVDIEGSTFAENTALVDGGAIADAVGVLTSDGGPSIRIGGGSVFSGNQADGDGGALRFTNLTELTVDRSTFRQNSAHVGGAAFIGGDAAADLSRSLWCENSAQDGAAVHTETTLPQVWVGDRMIATVASARGGAVSHRFGPLTIDHANLLANGGPSGSALYSDTTVDVVSSLIGWSSGSVALQAGSLNLGYDLFWANGAGDRSGWNDLGGNITGEDPLLDSFVPELGCDAADGYYSWWGPLTDAGDPAAPHDGDGTRGDIGAYGAYTAFDADGTPWAVDADGDLAPALYDCADGLDTIAPTLPDTPYDGIDTNCDDRDDFDLDGDGYDGPDDVGEDCDDRDARVHPNAADFGTTDGDCDHTVDVDRDGYGNDEDCDDHDPMVHPGAVEDPGPRDLDCVGPADVVRELQPHPCSTSPAAGLWGSLAVTLATVARRRARSK